MTDMRRATPRTGEEFGPKDFCQRISAGRLAMRLAFGLKAHSGWAALVALGSDGHEFCVVDRRRVELVEADALWAKQPYHAAEGLKPDKAEDVVRRGIDAARRFALQEMQAAVSRAHAADHNIAACAVLIAEPMPDWSVAEILAVHVRMHKAEGMLFRDVLVQAARACGLRLVTIQEKLLTEHAVRALGTSVNILAKRIATLGKTVGSPWGKDQKEATLAAMIALKSR